MLEFAGQNYCYLNEEPRHQDAEIRSKKPRCQDAKEEPRNQEAKNPKKNQETEKPRIQRRTKKSRSQRSISIQKTNAS